MPRGDLTRSRGIFTSKSSGLLLKINEDCTYNTDSFHAPATAVGRSQIGIIPIIHAKEKAGRLGISPHRAPKKPRKTDTRNTPRETPRRLPTVPSMNTLKLSETISETSPRATHDPTPHCCVRTCSSPTPGTSKAMRQFYQPFKRDA